MKHLGTGCAPMMPRAVLTAGLRAGGHIVLLAALAGAVRAADAGNGLTPHEVKVRAIFARVIGFRTSVGLGQVPAMADYLAGEFRAAGVPEADIHIIPLGETASMVVRYRGDGSGGKPILLLAHMDVVTAKREDWQRDPFTLIEENGYFYGRGTYDIKQGLTCLTATFLRLKAEGSVPRRDLVLVISGDEEVGWKTMQDLVQNHRESLEADFALNTDAGYATLDEATGQASVYGIETAEKTYASFELTVRNPGGLGRAMRNFAADPHDRAAVKVLSGDPTDVGMIRTTCIPTLLRGGHADNALPQAVRDQLQRIVGPKTEIAAVLTPHWSEASPLRADVLGAVSRAVHALHPGIPVLPRQDSGASDNLYTRAAGIPSYGTDETFIKPGDGTKPLT